MDDNKEKDEITQEDLNEFLDGLLEKGIFTDYISENREDLAKRMEESQKNTEEGLEVIFSDDILKEIY